VVIQVALAMVLLIASGLMIRTFREVRRVAPGFAGPSQVQTARVAIPETGVADPMQVLRIEREIVERLAAIPGVRSAAFVTALPMETEPEFASNNLVSVEGVTYAPGEVPPLRRIKRVSPGSFETLGTPLIAGRDFTWEDLFELRDVAVVSEGMARETWGGAQAAVGKRIRQGMGGTWREVVGVVGDVRDNGSHLPPPAIAYWPTMMVVQGRPQVSRSVAFAVRSDRAGTDSLVRELREVVWSVNPDLPLARVRTLADFYARSMASTSFALVMLAIAGVMALALGLIGIYGVISYAVSQRRRETGIRLALGAQPTALSAAFVKRAAALAGLGVAIGLAGAAGLSRLLASLLYGVEALDPLTYAACAIVLGAAAILASYLPARRAARVDPVEALRAE
jgi:predicted permease